MTPKQPKIGLVLTGGAAKGAYQVGVLQYLAERTAIEPDIIAGTSIGALNGAGLACYPPLQKGAAHLDRVWEQLGRETLLQPNRNLDDRSLFTPKPIEKSNTPVFGVVEAWTNFSPERIVELKKRGYRDAERCLAPIVRTFQIIQQQRRSQTSPIDSTRQLLDDVPLF